MKKNSMYKLILHITDDQQDKVIVAKKSFCPSDKSTIDERLAFVEEMFDVKVFGIVGNALKHYQDNSYPDIATIDVDFTEAKQHGLKLAPIEISNRRGIDLWEHLIDQSHETVAMLLTAQLGHADVSRIAKKAENNEMARSANIPAKVDPSDEIALRDSTIQLMKFVALRHLSKAHQEQRVSFERLLLKDESELLGSIIVLGNRKFRLKYFLVGWYDFDTLSLPNPKKVLAGILHQTQTKYSLTGKWNLENGEYLPLWKEYLLISDKAIEHKINRLAFNMYLEILLLGSLRSNSNAKDAPIKLIDSESFSVTTKIRKGATLKEEDCLRLFIKKLAARRVLYAFDIYDGDLLTLSELVSLLVKGNSDGYKAGLGTVFATHLGMSRPNPAVKFSKDNAHAFPGELKFIEEIVPYFPKALDFFLNGVNGDVDYEMQQKYELPFQQMHSFKELNQFIRSKKSGLGILDRPKLLGLLRTAFSKSFYDLTPLDIFECEDYAT